MLIKPDVLLGKGRGHCSRGPGPVEAVGGGGAKALALISNF